MMRGVSWPLAIWIAIRMEPNVKTTNESVSVMSVWNRVRAPSRAEPGQVPGDEAVERVKYADDQQREQH
jgi:hypothetical protein